MSVAFVRSWEAASVVFFVYTAVVGLTARGLPTGSRWRVGLASAVGAALPLLSASLPENRVLHGWVIPPALLLLGYWTSGLLFVGPMPTAERALADFDGALAVRRFAALLPRWVAEALECAYSGVYALIPIGLALHLTLGRAPNAARFWTVVLVTDYICFAALAWIQTRPPRALEHGEPWCAACRRFNLRLLGATSVQVNTFPSGHAAEALVAALLVVDAGHAVFLAMLLGAAAVSAGAVFGRYHYALDAIAGWLVAIVVWSALA